MTQTISQSPLIIMPPKSEYTLEDAFPTEVVCPVKPLGNRVLVMIRCPRRITANGIHIPEDDLINAYRNEQTAKVIAVGNGAFHFPSDGRAWASGEWYKAGDYVRVPLHGGDNHWVTDRHNKLIIFKTFKDYEVIALIEGDPLLVKTNYAYF